MSGGAARLVACGAALALCTAASAAPPPVTVRFVGEAQAQWEIVPGRPSVRVSRGEVFEAQVRVRNRSSQEVVAMVVKEIQPPRAVNALIHLGCGTTFTVILKPGEAANVPASYLVADDAPGELATLELAYKVYSFEPYRADPLAHGGRLYAERCASCHGLAGRGDGPTGRLLAGGVSDLRPALRGREDEALADAIASGVGPMPAFSPALGRTEQRALVLYLRELARREP